MKAMLVDFETSCLPIGCYVCIHTPRSSQCFLIAQVIQYDTVTIVFINHMVVVNVLASQPLIQPLFEF